MIHFDVKTDLNPHILDIPCSKAEKAVANQAMVDTMKYVPFRTGSLRARTRLQNSTIVYPGPYARYLWYGKAMVDSTTGRGPFYIPEVGYRFRKGAVLMPTNRDLVFHTPGTGPKWFETSKKRNMQKWLRVAERAIKNAK